MASVLRREIVKAFQLHGFTLRLDARHHFESLLLGLDADSNDRGEWISKVLDKLEKPGFLSSPLVNKEDLIRAIQECSEEEEKDDLNTLCFIDAFHTPKLFYSQERKKYLSQEGPSSLYADADAKAELFLARYVLLHQRTSRHDLFTPAVVGSFVEEKKFHLKNVEYLSGTTNKLVDVIVLGMLTQIKTGKYSLEDPTGVVDLDLSEAKFQSGLYTEGCFVLVEGWYEDRIFHVIAMGFPPTESAATTRAYFGNVNFFGGNLPNCAKSYPRLTELENDNNDSMFVFLSDVWLDKAEVRSKLYRLFSGYSSFPPTAFVFMGNFMSSFEESANRPKLFRQHFRALGEMISEFPELIESSKFVFVPGPTDPGHANIFPRPPLPKFVVEELAKRVPSAEFVTNPCRVQYCTQEIVLFREDIVTKMCRNCIYFPETGDIPDHFTKTVISQSHLAPLPLHVCPVYWEHDRAMYLYPIPDLLVIGDKFDPFTSHHLDCRVINPGSFSKTEYSFKTYLPKTKKVEDSQIPHEDVA